MDERFPGVLAVPNGCRRPVDPHVADVDDDVARGGQVPGVQVIDPAQRRTQLRFGREWCQQFPAAPLAVRLLRLWQDGPVLGVGVLDRVLGRLCCGTWTRRAARTS